MTREPVTLEGFAAARERAIADIAGRLDEDAQRFLLSLHDAEPDFDAIALPRAAALPAVRWKVNNSLASKLITQQSTLSSAAFSKVFLQNDEMN